MVNFIKATAVLALPLLAYAAPIMDTRGAEQGSDISNLNDNEVAGFDTFVARSEDNEEGDVFRRSEDDQEYDNLVARSEYNEDEEIVKRSEDDDQEFGNVVARSDDGDEAFERRALPLALPILTKLLPAVTKVLPAVTKAIPKVTKTLLKGPLRGPSTLGPGGGDNTQPKQPSTIRKLTNNLLKFGGGRRAVKRSEGSQLIAELASLTEEDLAKVLSVARGAQA